MAWSKELEQIKKDLEEESLEDRMEILKGWANVVNKYIYFFGNYARWVSAFNLDCFNKEEMKDHYLNFRQTLINLLDCELQFHQIWIESFQKKHPKETFKSPDEDSSYIA